MPRPNKTRLAEITNATDYDELLAVCPTNAACPCVFYSAAIAISIDAETPDELREATTNLHRILDAAIVVNLSQGGSPLLDAYAPAEYDPRFDPDSKVNRRIDREEAAEFDADFGATADQARLN